MTTQQPRFERVADHAWGYDPAQVDDFLARVRALRAAEDGSREYRETAGDGVPDADGVRHVGSRQIRERVFDRVRGGYDPAVVDPHLDELEDAIFAEEQRAFVAEHGVARWDEHVELLGELLLGRLNRPRTQRFRRPATHRTPGYAVADVDVLCDRLVEQLRSAPEVDPRMLREAVFRSAQGQRCYEEQQVDAFLDRAVEFVLALRTRA
ncbi:MAG: hypothetical protein Q4C90_07540 [Kocuria sp.]|uniref:hypothetical protein n=1 Tax=Kocuria TaxID=57493 RepID=UPI0011A8F153|nr:MULTISPECIES: hypothetical protein [Kocuria]MBS6029316.1 hypothetical protein [Kocuria rhizophila]MDO4256999.1 hypothetical protein [Kocuria sp.]